MTRKRPYGSGSVFQVGDRWWFSRSFQENGKRVRRVIVGKTREEAIALGEARTDWNTKAAVRQRAEIQRREELRVARSQRHAADHSTGRERAARAADYATRIIDMGREAGWSSEHIAAVVIATLTPNRVRRAIFGPCVYCGTWFADQVDHIIPLTRGGTDSPENLTSACKPCNSEKRTRTPEEWRIAS